MYILNAVWEPEDKQAVPTMTLNWQWTLVLAWVELNKDAKTLEGNNKTISLLFPLLRC